MSVTDIKNFFISYISYHSPSKKASVSEHFTAKKDINFESNVSDRKLCMKTMKSHSKHKTVPLS